MMVPLRDGRQSTSMGSSSASRLSNDSERALLLRFGVCLLGLDANHTLQATDMWGQEELRGLLFLASISIFW